MPCLQSFPKTQTLAGVFGVFKTLNPPPQSDLVASTGTAQLRR